MSDPSPDIVNASGWRAVIKRWRRNNRGRLNRVLTRIGGTAEPKAAALAPGTRRVLVIRLNKRLGNILFLTPMLRSLAASLPQARIDVLIQDPQHRVLLESLPNVANVWIQPRSAGALIGLIRRLRGLRYDLAIDPTGNSTSNRLAMVLCGARQRMGFAGRDQWLRLTHAAPKPRERHQATQAATLIETATAQLEVRRVDHLGVFPDASAQAAAADIWRAALGDAATGAPVIGFFAQATGGKQLDADWWRQWQAVLATHAPAARLLQILPPGDAPPLTDDMPHARVAALDVLAALVARANAFVAADSGPMHLAAAAGTPVVGLFRATQPDEYAPLGRRCVWLAGAALTPAGAARAAAEIVAGRRSTRAHSG